ncbi:hypothetical protein D3C86_2127510 [compost metagenome]
MIHFIGPVVILEPLHQRMFGFVTTELVLRDFAGAAHRLFFKTDTEERIPLSRKLLNEWIIAAYVLPQRHPIDPFCLERCLAE